MTLNSFFFSENEIFDAKMIIPIIHIMTAISVKIIHIIQP